MTVYCYIKRQARERKQTELISSYVATAFVNLRMTDEKKGGLVFLCFNVDELFKNQSQTFLFKAEKERKCNEKFFILIS
jgi:hypothetical protein